MPHPDFDVPICFVGMPGKQHGSSAAYHAASLDVVGSSDTSYGQGGLALIH